MFGLCVGLYRCNLWSFGIILLELLSGRHNMDDFFAAEERNLLQWCRPYLLDPKRLYLSMDPELKGRYPTSKAKMVADLALQCLAEDPEARPSMRGVAVSLMPTSGLPNSKADEALLSNGFRNIENGYIGNSSYLGSSTKFKDQQALLSNGFHSTENGYIGNNSYLGSSIKPNYSKSYSLASILASPARSFTASSHLNEAPHSSPRRNSRTRFTGFLSEEIARESSHLPAGLRGDHPFLSKSLFLTDEAMVHAVEPRLHRSLSSSRE